MKRLFTFFALIFPLSLSAQDYGNICSQGITFFMKTDSSLRAFRQDSVYLPGSYDSVFFSYPTIGIFEDLYSCLDTTTGSVLGRKIVKTHDGWFYFFNAGNDTISIFASAGLNSAWKFCLLPGNAFLQAKVTSVITENILGMTDQVKVITLQAKDQNLNDIPHLFNQKIIKLSQHYGLARMYDVNFIPADTTAWSVAGKSHPSMGLQNLSRKEAYTFDPGDVFHYHRDFSTYNSGGYENSINRILQRIVYGNWDSVSYRIEACLAMDYGPPTTHYTSFDTVWVTYNFTSPADDPGISYLPDEFAPQGNICSSYSACKWFNNRTVKGINPMTMGKASDTCWNFLVDGGAWGTGYAKGLGQVYSHYNDFMGTQNMKNMVYFKKGSETWGTPVATSCNVLVAIEDHSPAIPVKLLILPNPVTDNTEISVEGLRPDVVLQFNVTDLTGRIVYESPAFRGSYLWSRNGLKPGLYILGIRSDDGETAISSKIILK